MSTLYTQGEVLSAKAVARTMLTSAIYEDRVKARWVLIHADTLRPQINRAGIKTGNLEAITPYQEQAMAWALFINANPDQYKTKIESALRDIRAEMNIRL